MMFTKELCNKTIILDCYNYERWNLPYIETNLFRVIRLKLIETPTLNREACIISGNVNDRFDFFVDLYEDNTIGSYIECDPWVFDEDLDIKIGINPRKALFIKLDEVDKANIHERLNELCLKEYGESFEELIFS